MKTKNLLHRGILMMLLFQLIFICSAKTQPLDSLWMYYYGHDTIDECALDVIQKSDSGYLEVGYSLSSSPAYDYSANVVSIDKDGQFLWEKKFCSPGDDKFFSIIGTSDSNYLLGGEFNDKAWLVKMNEDGDTLWSRSYGNSFGLITSMQVLANSDFIVSGNPAEYNTYNFFLLKANQNGDTIWSHKYIFEPFSYWWDQSHCVRQTYDGGFILATGGLSGYGDPFSIIVKTDSNGDTLWTMRKVDDIYLNMKNLSDIQVNMDTIYIVGSSVSQPGVFVIKMMTNGNILWSKHFESQYASSWFGYFGTLTNVETLLIAGVTSTWSPITGGIYACNIDKNGILLWESNYGKYEFGIHPRSIRNSLDNNYIVSGYNYTSGSYDIFTLKLGEKPSQINQVIRENNFNLRIIPNPVKSKARIDFTLQEKGLTIMTIYNLYGKKIDELIRQETPKGKQKIAWDVAGYSSGIYFVQLKSKNHICVEKIIIAQ